MEKIFVLLLVFCVGCASTTVIQSQPPGALVYMANIQKGTTPLTYSDTALAGTVTAIQIKKEGYKTLDTVIRKDKFQAGPCIGGVIILFPFAWMLGYQDAYEFVLEKD